MKVIFNCHVPFMLTHGGMQIQIDQTMAALTKVGVAVEPLRWWADKQKTDILQHFGRLSRLTLQSAHEKGIKIVISDLLTGQGSRSRFRHVFHKTMVRLMTRALPHSFTAAFAWDTYRLADACLALTPLEAE